MSFLFGFLGALCGMVVGIIVGVVLVALGVHDAFPDGLQR